MDQDILLEKAKNMRSELQQKNEEKRKEMLTKPLDIVQVRSSIPRNFRSHITEEFLTQLEDALCNEEIGSQIKENFLSYTQVLNDADPNTNIWDYVNAVKFISFKLMGYSIEESWKKTFPVKCSELLKEGKEKWINKYANSYNKRKIVNKIYQQTLIPSYVLNAPLFQEALNTLAEMVRNDDVRGMAKVKACEAILNYTKPPEVSKAEVQVNIKQTDAIAELREIAEQFANNMKNAIENKTKTIDEIIDVQLITDDK